MGRFVTTTVHLMISLLDARRQRRLSLILNVQGSSLIIRRPSVNPEPYTNEKEFIET